MASSYTSLLGLVLPVQGELQGTWGDVVNNELTSLLDTAVAGTTTLNTDADVTLTTTTGAANQARQAIILWTANGTVTRNITAPAQSKTYVVINATGSTQSIVVRGVGPTTGVTVLAGEKAVVAWNGSDFVKVSTFGGSGTFTNLTVTGNATVDGNTTLGDATTDTVQVNGYMGVGGAGNSNIGIRLQNTLTGGTTATGLYSNPTADSGTTSSITGVGAIPKTAAASFTVSNVYGFFAFDTSKGAGSTITNQHGLYIADQTQGTNNFGITSLVSSGSNKWNIYASGTANNAFAGNVRIGSTTAPTNALDVTGAMTVSGNTTLGDATTDTVTVNGYMGVGGAAVASRGIEVTSSALTGSGQRGISSTPTATSAATTGVIGVLGGGNTAAASFTAGYSIGLYAQNAVKGAGSTITNLYGVYIEDQTQGTNNYGITSAVSSGTNKWNIYASGTANNAFAGNVRIGSTTAPTNALDVTGAMTVSGNATLGDATTDTVQVNGYMGVGGAAAGTHVKSTITGTTTGSTTQIGCYVNTTFDNSATSQASGIRSTLSTVDASFIASQLAHFRAGAITKGAASTITNLYGLYIEDQTQGTNNYGITSLVSSGTNKWNIYASGTAANYFAGNVGIGSATLVSNSSVSISASGGSISALSFVNTQVSGKTWRMGPGVGTGLATDFGFYNDTDAQRVIGITGGAAGNVKLFQNGLERFSTNATEAVFNDPGNDYDFRVESDTNTHALFVDAGNSRVGINNSSPTNALSVTGAMDVSGDVTLGDASTDTVQVNGYMGVGGSTDSSMGVYLRNNALTGTSQRGFYSSITGTSAATSAVDAFLADPKTAAASYTVTNVRGFLAADATKGAGSTITNQHGVYVADQTQGTNNYGITSLVSSGTNKWNIYASGTAANYFAGVLNVGTTTLATGVTGHINGTLRVANSNGGTLQLEDSDVADGSTPFWSLQSDTGTFRIFSANRSGTATTGSAERMRLDASGNLGLGVTPSAWGSTFPTMQIGDGGAITARSNKANEIYLSANAYHDGSTGWRYIETDYATSYYQFNGVHVWRTAPSGTAGNAITFTERANIGLTEMVVNDPGNDYDFRVESDTNTHALFVDAGNGRVGINESAPDATLSVNGVIQATAPSATTIANGATATVITPNRGFSYINVSRSDTAAFGLLLLVFRTTSTLEIVSTVSDKTSASYSASVSGTALQVTNSSGSEKAFYASAVCIAFGTGD